MAKKKKVIDWVRDWIRKGKEKIKNILGGKNEPIGQPI